MKGQGGSGKEAKWSNVYSNTKFLSRKKLLIEKIVVKIFIKVYSMAGVK